MSDQFYVSTCTLPESRKLNERHKKAMSGQKAMHIKKFATLLFTLLIATFLMACAGSSEPTETTSPDGESSVPEKTSAPEVSVDSEDVQISEMEETESVPETNADTEGTKVLVAYFSATKTTEGVAEHIANGLNANLYEIVPEDPYTDEDLNYNDNNSRSTIEMNDPSSRPAISGQVENMEQYDIVFIGYAGGIIGLN